MADKASILKQYDYKANANLVLQPERRGRVGDEPTGAPETLWGRITGQFGDRALQGRPPELLERLQKLKKRKRDMGEADEEGESAAGRAARRRDQRDHFDVLAATEEGQEANLYRPRTRETRNAYEELLTFVQQRMGAQPHDVIRSAAYEILSVLKDDRRTDPQRKKEIEDTLTNDLREDMFASLVAIGKKITDYSAEEAAAGEGGDKLDDEYGVAVVIDEDEEDEDDKEDVIVRDEDSGDEDVEQRPDAEDAAMLPALAKEDGGDEDEDIADVDSSRIDPIAIDAFWLQREIAKFISDEHSAQQMAGEVLEVLAEKDVRTCENKLVGLMGFDRFDFIKTLLRNRARVYFCVRLGQAQDAASRAAIEKEMEADEDGQGVLEALHHTDTLAEQRKGFGAKVREEARSMHTKTGDSSMAEAETDDTGANVVDLDSAAFASGGHFMSNKRCELPPGSFRTQRKGYEEVHVPALKPKTFGEREKLISVKDMPAWSRPAFAKSTKSLNRVQSRCYETAFNSSENLLLCAPTGAGKTLVAVLTILREIGLCRNEATGEVDVDAFKVIYVAPMKSLVAEMVNNFSIKLKPYGVTVRELTGDTSMTRQQINETQVIVCTPEKWDIITRKSGERAFTQFVRLVIIDEIHLLHDDRGPVLESIVARTIRQIEASQEMVRLVGLSATLPNYDDVSALLRVDPDKGLFFFDNSYRPCPLEQQFIGITERKPLKRFQIANEIVYEKVMDHAGKNQILVFVHSRKETAKTARFIRDMAMENDTLGKFLREDSASREILKVEAESETVRSVDLKELLPYGFAIHHAGMARTDRTLVEDLFADGHVQVLLSTATLAWGVNLPAHTVIIKGTQVYDPEKGRWVELSFLDIMQMMGRAGRPQYDTKGTGIVITQHSELQYYLSVMNQQLPIESQFLAKLADNLNAEIVLGTVRSVDDACEWLTYTYLYVRMLQAPELYGIRTEEAASDKTLMGRRRDLVHSAALILDRTGLIRYDRRGGLFQATDLGRVASHYYVTHASMATFNEHLKPTLSDIELFRLFSLSNEFRNISVREEEKAELQRLLERVPIPVKESCEEPSAKVNVLLQSYISQLPLDGFALLSDMVYVTQSAARIVRALHEIVLRRGWAQLANKLLTLAKMVQNRTWLSQSPLRQFKGIPDDVIRRIENKDFPWERFFDLSPQELGELVRYEKMGKIIYRHVHQFPRVELRAHVQPITRSVLHVELTITPEFRYEYKTHGPSEPFWIVVEDTDSERILHFEHFVIKHHFAEEEHAVTFTVPIYEPLPPQYFVRVVSDRWLHSEKILPVSFRHLILPEKFPPPTELLDLQPLPVSALVNDHYQALYAEFTHFNPIQTQSFTALYNSDDNVLLAAPTGSGKTICAEFAMLRAFTLNEDALCVYVAPLPELCAERFRDWRVKFGEKLGKRVVRLTGAAAADSKLLDASHIAIATPEHWDAVSRRWKQRRSVQKAALFVVDELHLIGGSRGPVIEVIVSRMRFMSSQIEHKARIVALSASLANAKDLGDWIGVRPQSLFSFHPNVRPVPLEIHLQGFDIPHFSSRMMSMAKPAYHAALLHGGAKPIIVFTPNRRQARLYAEDMCSFAAADGDPLRFLRCAPEDVAPFAAAVQSDALRSCLSQGVAYYHEGLDARDRATARRVFAAGAAQVCVCDVDCCWSLGLEAHLVVIVGTERYDGRSHSYVDYPITDVLQMLGRACRQRQDDTGKASILCYAPKKEFFKKFLYEPFPVESHLDHMLADHLNAEIVTRTIENKQDAVDYLTWTFMYRRLAMNPNYYNMQGTSHRHLSDHLSELVEATLKDLEQSRCIAIEEEMDLSPLNLGMIAAYYYIQYTTIELLASSIAAKTKLKGMIEILASASEFEDVAVRHGEDKILRRLGSRVPMSIPIPARLAGLAADKSERQKWQDTSVKVNLLLQAHFSRISLGADQRVDAHRILRAVPRLLQAAVDVTSSSGWLRPALAAMELSQMVTQAVWDRDSILRQVPHFAADVIERLTKARVENVFDLMDMDDAKREELLAMAPAQLADVARWCNRYPSVDVAYDIVDADAVSAGGAVMLNVQLEREEAEQPEEGGTAGVGPVVAPFFPDRKEEGWWLVVGDVKQNQLLCIKRITLAQRAKAKLEFTAPSAAGEAHLTLFFMCDAYAGCDQEYEFDLCVGETMEDAE